MRVDPHTCPLEVGDRVCWCLENGSPAGERIKGTVVGILEGAVFEVDFDNYGYLTYPRRSLLKLKDSPLGQKAKERKSFTSFIQEVEKRYA